MVNTRLDLELFKINPALFIEKVIKEYAAESSANHLKALDNNLIFDEPLVGLADGDDPIFLAYKKVVADSHLTPREAFEMHLRSQGDDSQKKPEHLTVISFVLPVSRETRLSLRRETVVPSLRWNHTRWHGQDFVNELSRYLVSLLVELGHQAVAPEVASFYQIKRLPQGPVANWSQRHMAYAAGLGTFSLSDGFITPRGIAMRCGSVVTDLVLPPSPRRYENHLANCLFYRYGSCRRCIERCPAGAITEQGHNKNKCEGFLFNKQKVILKELGREEGYIGRYLGCGLCQTKVPCEAGIPPAGSAKNQAQ
jgi:epoxyqueuosine reductase QueG